MRDPIQLLADKNIFQLDRALPAGVNLSLFDPAEGFPQNADRFDALFIRTVTPVNPETLPLTGNLRFIGACSAGFDHVDLNYLENRQIKFNAASGNNSRSVAEYVCTSMILYACKKGRKLRDLNAGIIGAGAVGTALQNLLEKTGVNYMLFDPPKEKRDKWFKSCSLQSVLDCEVLTFHVPLTFSGPYKTHHWLDSEKLESTRHSLVINSSRGGVVDESALLESKKMGLVDEYILDVWEGEPLFRDDSARNAFIATPHIAGYSIQSKWRATAITVEAFCKFFRVVKPDLSFPSDLENGSVSVFHSSDDEPLDSFMRKVHPVCRYDANLRKLIGNEPSGKEKGFSALRTDFPFRHEFSFIRTGRQILQKYPLLKGLGIKAE